MSASDIIALRKAYALVCPRICSNVSEGSTGPPGPTGPQGDTGPTGPQGDTGPTGFSTGAVYYFNNNIVGALPNTASDRDLNRTISTNGGIQTTVSHTFSNTPGETHLMQTFITPNSDPNITELVGGTFNFEIYADTTAASATISDHTIFTRVYLYHISGPRTLISESFKIPIFNKAAIPTLYLFSSAIEAQTILNTDRFEIEIWTQSITNTNNKTLTLFFNNGSIGQVTTTLNPFTPNFPETNYRDTTTLSYFQNDGTPYYSVKTSPKELNTLLNDPNVITSYLAIIYSYVGTPTSPTILIKDFLGNTLQTLTLNATATDPTISEFIFTIGTVSVRALQIVATGGFDVSNYINIRTIVIGYA